MSIEVQIDQLILDGIPLAWHQRPFLKTAVETELTRLLNEGGLPPTLHGEANHLRTPAAIQIKNSHNPTQLGEQIARSVYGGKE